MNNEFIEDLIESNNIIIRRLQKENKRLEEEL